MDRLSGPERLAQGLPWRVSVNTVADSMRRQGLKGRKVKRNRGLTRQDKTAPKFPDLLKRDFTAATINTRWVGDITEIPTAQGKLYLATVIDLCSRRLLAAPTSEHPDAELACDAIRMAVAVRGGAPNIAEVIFHTDRGSTYTADDFTKLCVGLKIRQSMGRVGSCFDCGRGVVLLHPGVGGPEQAHVRDPRGGPAGHQRLGGGVLQPAPPALHPRDAQPDRA